MSKPEKTYDTMEYSRWLEARHERPEQPLFFMRHHDRGMGVVEEVAVRIYEAVDQFLQLVEEDISYLRLQWKQNDNGPDDPSTYCSFRVLIKASGQQEIEHGYDEPPVDLINTAGRLEAFNALVEACELVDPDTWNHFVHFKIFNAGPIATIGDLRRCLENEGLDHFMAERKQWGMEHDTQPSTAAPRPTARM